MDIVSPEKEIFTGEVDSVTLPGTLGSFTILVHGTYVHNLKNGVAFGAALPETDNRMHGADEFAVLDELLLSAKIFAQVIVDLCS